MKGEYKPDLCEGSRERRVTPSIVVDSSDSDDRHEDRNYNCDDDDDYDGNYDDSDHDGNASDNNNHEDFGVDYMKLLKEKELKKDK